MSSNQRLWAIPGFGFAQPADGSAVEPAADWIPVTALAETSWDSSLQSGRYTFLLQVIDGSGNTYYGVQRGWLDD